MACIEAGTGLDWLVDPGDKSVLVFKPQQFPEIESEGDKLPVMESLSVLELSTGEPFSWLSLN